VRVRCRARVRVRRVGARARVRVSLEVANGTHQEGGVRVRDNHAQRRWSVG
jgi:hypothetical protein